MQPKKISYNTIKKNNTLDKFVTKKEATKEDSDKKESV
jgi:hypothetical protein